MSRAPYPLGRGVQSWLQAHWEAEAIAREQADLYEAEQARSRHEEEASEAAADGPIKFPRKLQCLFDRTKRHEKDYRHRRYTVPKGGRGGAKSWSIGRALLVLGASETLRIGVFREVQKSIRESVHQLLRDQIAGMGLGGFYTVTDTEIRGANGTLFIFAGLSTQTATSIKSYEGLDIAWIEEAQTVTKRSFNILDPTIRKANAEVWVSMNPELDTDDMYVMFCTDARPPAEDCAVIDINWRDNPWFPDVLEKMRLRAKATMRPDEYNNIWNGTTRAAVDGAIYADEVSEMMAAGRITKVPYNPSLKLHVVMDLGWNDKMFAILAQKQANALLIVKAHEWDHTTLDGVSSDLRLVRANWGKIWLPHDGTHGDFKTGKSTHKLMQEKSWITGKVPNVPIETGIKRAREMMSRIYIDETRALPLIQALRRYKRAINKHGEGTLAVHDAASHGADAFRYLALVQEYLKNEDDFEPTHHNARAQYPIDDEVGM